MRYSIHNKFFAADDGSGEAGPESEVVAPAPPAGPAKIPAPVRAAPAAVEAPETTAEDDASPGNQAD